MQSPWHAALNGRTINDYRPIKGDMWSAKKRGKGIFRPKAQAPAFIRLRYVKRD